MASVSRFSEEQTVKILPEADKNPVVQVAKKHGGTGFSRTTPLIASSLRFMHQRLKRA
jgi:hypothetical protein